MALQTQSFRSLILATAGITLLSIPHVFAQNVTRPPSKSDREHVATMGWVEAANVLNEALKTAWKPGRSGLAGSSGNAAFQNWLLMARWAELMSRDESAETARFLSHSLLSDPEAGDAKPTFFPPGIDLPANLVAAEPAELLDFINDDGFVSSPIFSAFVPDGFEPRRGTLADRVTSEFASAMVKDDKFLQQFFGTLDDRDFTPALLETLSKIYTERPEQWDAYQSLAIALAVVYDQRFPKFWPHHQVDSSLVPITRPDPLAMFDFWVESQESSRTLSDIKKLTPDTLKFVVDAPVETSELIWAQQNLRYTRANFNRAFSDIEYAHARLESQAYSWTDSRYLLEEIQKAGGICVDQAYFAMLAGKARGLPTLYFSGQGTDGGHAWFGYLKSESRWDLECGRYENQQYAVGEALDPQSWRPISDHELESLSQSYRRTPAYVASKNDLVMAATFEQSGDPDKAVAALESAIATSPRNPDAWNEMGEFLARSAAPVPRRIAHHEAALKAFPNDNDFKVSHQRAIAALALDSGDTTRAEQLQKKIISQNRRTRSDISVSTSAESVKKLLADNQTDAAISEIRSILSRLGKTAGGNIFYEIIRPSVDSLRASGEDQVAQKLINDARRAINPEQGGILDVDFSKLEANAPSE